MPRAKTIRDIDVSWFKCEDYNFWKQDKLNKISKPHDLAWYVNHNASKFKEDPTDEFCSRELLYAYNCMRELLLQPAAAALQEIDYNWVSMQRDS